MLFFVTAYFIGEIVGAIVFIPLGLILWAFFHITDKTNR